jgi:hypothetical protein
VVVLLSKAGDQVPLYPLVDVVGNGLKLLPLQIGATGLKVITALGLTVMVKVVGVAHWPTTGVKV